VGKVERIGEMVNRYFHSGNLKEIVLLGVVRRR
jgi:hypothetical protein